MTINVWGQVASINYAIPLSALPSIVVANRLVVVASSGLELTYMTPAPGWAVATGTATRTTFVTSSVTLEQLAQRVKALIDDLVSKNIVGA